MNDTTSPFSDEQATEILRLGVYELARIAECGDPDTLDSKGANYLDYVRSDVLECLMNDTLGAYPEDTASTIASECVPVYTHALALTFVDLCAYREDIDDMGAADLESAMRWAVYQIGDRLARYLIEKYAPGAE